MATGSGKTFTAVNIAYRLISMARRAGFFSSSIARISGGRPSTKFTELYNVQRLSSNRIDGVSASSCPPLSASIQSARVRPISRKSSTRNRPMTCTLLNRSTLHKSLVKVTSSQRRLPTSPAHKLKVRSSCSRIFATLTIPCRGDRRYDRDRNGREADRMRIFPCAWCVRGRSSSR